MKKFTVMVLGALFLMTSAVTAQGFITRNAEYSPYVNVGTSVSSNTQSFQAELGAENDVSKYAFTAAHTNSDIVSRDGWRAGVIGYWKIANRKTDNKVDVFATGQAQIDLNRFHALTLSPGLAAEWNLWKHFTPQFNLSFPIRENAVFRNRPLGVQAGLSVNIK